MGISPVSAKEEVSELRTVAGLGLDVAGGLSASACGGWDPEVFPSSSPSVSSSSKFKLPEIPGGQEELSTARSKTGVSERKENFNFLA